MCTVSYYIVDTIKRMMLITIRLISVVIGEIVWTKCYALNGAKADRKI